MENRPVLDGTPPYTTLFSENVGVALATGSAVSYCV